MEWTPQPEGDCNPDSTGEKQQGHGKAKDTAHAIAPASNGIQS